jgi:hypothetical protein
LEQGVILPPETASVQTARLHGEQALLLNIARGSPGETKDGIQEGLERGYFAPEVGELMFILFRRAMVANLRWLTSLKRRDPERDRGAPPVRSQISRQT